MAVAAAAAAARPALRAPVLRRAARRFQASSAADKAAGAARDAAAKAQQGLSRVTSAAAPALAGAARGVSGALANMGGRTGRLVAFVERKTPLAVYYAKVGLELGRLVFHGQKMSPPSMATVQSYYQNLWRAVQTGALSRAPASLVHSLRSLSSVQLAAGAVVAAECLGFFTVGEMLGRFKLVGYHGHTAHHH